MATQSEWMKPAGYGIRDPLDTKQHHGRIINPPRLNQMGGLDKLHEPHGHFKNDITIRKPGSTK